MQRTQNEAVSVHQKNTYPWIYSFDYIKTWYAEGVNYINQWNIVHNSVTEYKSVTTKYNRINIHTEIKKNQTQ